MRFFKSLEYRLRNFFPEKGYTIPNKKLFYRKENKGKNVAIECFTGYSALNVYYISILAKLIKEQDINNIYLIYKSRMDRYLWQNKILRNYLSAKEIILSNEKVSDRDFNCFVNGEKDITKIKFKEFSIGQDIYFSKLRAEKVGRYPLKIELYDKEIKQFISRYSAIDEVIEKYDIDCIFQSDIAYTSYLPLFMAALNKNIKSVVSFPYGKTGKIGGRSYLSATEYNDVDRRFPFSFSDSTWEQASKLEEGRVNDFVNKRFRGESSLFDGSYQKGKSKGVSSMCMSKENAKALIACHLLWDNPGYESLFNDYTDWLINTLSVVKNRKDVDWIIKSHPSEKYLGTNEKVKMIVSEFFSGDIPSNVYFLEADTELSTFEIIKDVDFVVTVRGTITFEAASLGKKVLTAGKGPHSGLAIAEEFSSKESYIERLMTLDNFHFENDLTARKALYTYMEIKAVYSPILNDLYNGKRNLEDIVFNGEADSAISKVHDVIKSECGKDIQSCC
ncbi:hypothetical protein [Vibrio ostreicida]|uniref:hypothetical protein n=1 Tax=Vibrio ostreicida TaxID=526588 RepID=UPI000970BFA2|nr:hypothetical protein [Vibrio ostreicida]